MKKNLTKCVKFLYLMPGSDGSKTLRRFTGQHRQFVVDDGGSFAFLGVRCSASGGSLVTHRPVRLRPKLYEHTIGMKNTTAHASWFGRFRSLIIVIWDLFGIWCLQFGIYHRVARTIKPTPET